MGVVYPRRRCARRPRSGAQADEGHAGRHGAPAVRARVPLDLVAAPPALPPRLRLRRAGRRAVLHDGAVPGAADHQPGRPSLEDLLEPLFQVTLALDYIHHQGIVHRDIKPSNILVRPAARADGRPGFEAKLMDFGLAKYYGVKSSLSAEGGFVGTVAYCAPEQINNDELDHRADLYCLGLVSYELLSGRYPFSEARLAGMRPLMRAQLNDKPRPLAEVDPEVPAPIADAVMQLPPQGAAAPARLRRRCLRDAIAAYLGIDDQTAIYGDAMAPARPVLSVTGFVCRSLELEALDDVLRRCLSPPGIAGPASSETPPSLIVVERRAGDRQEQRRAGGRADRARPRLPGVRGAVLRRQPGAVPAVRRDHPPADRRAAAAGAPRGECGSRRGPDGHSRRRPARRIRGASAGDRQRLQRRAAPHRTELRKYLPGEAYQQVDFGREADYIFRALSAFFVEMATLQPVCLSFEDLQWADKSSLDLLRHLAAALDAARRSGSDGSTAAPRLMIVASARTGYPAARGRAGAAPRTPPGHGAPACRRWPRARRAS